MAKIEAFSLQQAFPQQYTSAVMSVSSRTVCHYPALEDVRYDTLLSNQQHLKIPHRLDLRTKKLSSPVFRSLKFSDLEATILSCLLTRHSNGHIRQQHMQTLIDTKHPEIAIPFVIRLLGDYVLEVLLVIEPFIIKHERLVITFLADNPRFWKTQKSRIISYWNEYYRHRNSYLISETNLCEHYFFSQLTDYPIWQLVLKIESLLTVYNQSRF